VRVLLCVHRSFSMPTFPDSGRSRGMANITFSSAEEAAEAIKQDGADMNGRSLSVQYAQPRAPRDSFKSRGENEPNVSCFVGNLSFDIDEDSLREALKGASPCP
jgi:RNA recognition motif-containing protein